MKDPMSTFRSVLSSTQKQTSYLLLLIVFGGPAFIIVRLLFPDLAGPSPNPNEPAFVLTYGPPLFAALAAMGTLLQLQRYFNQFHRFTTLGQRMPSALPQADSQGRSIGSETRELIDTLISLHSVSQALRSENEQQRAELQRLSSHYESLHRSLLSRMESLLSAPVEELPDRASARQNAPHAMEGLRQNLDDALTRARSQRDLIDQIVRQTHHSHAETESAHERLLSLRSKSSALSTAMQELMNRTQTVGQIAASVKLLASEIDHVALNATIEAARAGDVGRGFSIVAAEVRSLAEQSKGAAQKMRQVLEEIQQASKSTLSFAMESEQSIEELADTTRQTAASLLSLENEATEAQDSVSQLLSSMESQTGSVSVIQAALHGTAQGSEQLQRLIHRNEELRHILYSAQTEKTITASAVSQGARR